LTSNNDERHRAAATAPMASDRTSQLDQQRHPLTSDNNQRQHSDSNQPGASDL
jgi:hypothetical protein